MDLKFNDSFKIQVHHIGGIEGCGPIDILEFFKQDVEWTFYDADKENLEEINVNDRQAKLINKCVGESNEVRKFNVFKTASANSLYLPNERAKSFMMKGKSDNKTWGEDTELVESVDVETYRLDTLIDNREINRFDVLSVDAQASDLGIIKSLGKYLDDIICVVCEIEFQPLYQNQPLFHDVHKFMWDNHFILDDIMNQQWFKFNQYPNAFRGSGFLTVGECVYLKDPFWIMDNFTKEKAIEKCLKISAIAIAFAQQDFALDILQELEKRFNVSIEEIGKIVDVGYVAGMSDLLKLYRTVYGKYIK